MSEKTRKIIGVRLKEARVSQGLSQERLSLMTGVERSYLAKVEAGLRNATIDVIERLSEGLGLSMEDLFKDL